MTGVTTVVTTVAVIVAVIVTIIATDATEPALNLETAVDRSSPQWKPREYWFSAFVHVHL
jgi:hypothetical protein